MNWLLVVIMVASTEPAQAEHSKIYETTYTEQTACLKARQAVLAQYSESAQKAGQLSAPAGDKKLIHVTCIPKKAEKKPLLAR